MCICASYVGSIGIKQKENLKRNTDRLLVAQRQEILCVLNGKDFRPSERIQVEIKVNLIKRISNNKEYSQEIITHL